MESKGAVLSKCKKYRYRLWRIWDKSKAKVMFVMLNPSTADASDDDPTIRRCINFARSWGYGGIYVGNIYAYRTAYPKELKEAGFPVGSENCSHLKKMNDLCDKIVCAWGNGQGLPLRITENFENLHYLELAKDGTPKHPLYLKKDLRPVKL